MGVNVAVVTIATGQAGIDTIGNRAVVVAVGVGVGTGVPAVGVITIDQAVAVIVHPVIAIRIVLDSSGVDRLVAVVTIPVANTVAVTVPIGLVGRHNGVTVIVQAVAQLCGP